MNHLKEKFRKHRNKSFHFMAYLNKYLITTVKLFFWVRLSYSIKTLWNMQNAVTEMAPETVFKFIHF